MVTVAADDFDEAEQAVFEALAARAHVRVGRIPSCCG
jgi:hypothetical protein